MTILKLTTRAAHAARSTSPRFQRPPFERTKRPGAAAFFGGGVKHRAGCTHFRLATSCAFDNPSIA
jgi:hypothetical protein